jgi:hypothetical protein
MLHILQMTHYAGPTMNTQPDSTAAITVVGPADVFPKVTLVPPLPSVFIIVALEIDHRLPIAYFWESRRKKAAIGALKGAAKSLSAMDGVLDATVFKTWIAPPGRGEYLKQRPEVAIARYDLVLLLELENADTARAVRASDDWAAILDAAAKLARKSLVLSAKNVRRMGSVDHSRDGVFLFNYFYADNLAQNLAIWEYTAGWFQDQTGLDNSTLLVPDADQGSDYMVINHCRWDRARDILPSLIFKKSFKQFVLANFNANRVAPIPILYRLA